MYVVALTDCLLLDSHGNTAIWVFWEKVTIGHILPTFHLQILSKLKVLAFKISFNFF